MPFSFDQIIDRSGTRSLKWTAYGRDVLPLWVADMDFQAPEPARQALREAVDHGIFGYEMPQRKLAQTVAARMHRLYGWQVSPEWVLPIPGVVVGFHVAARAACRAGEGILVQPPVYPPFLHVAGNTGCVTQLAPLQAAAERHTLRYGIDWQAFEGAFNSGGVRTGMFLLCHPHNPTGQVHTRSELERMADICLRNRAVICSDEIHSELLLGGAGHIPMASLGEEVAQQTITLISASKTFNVVGLSCSFAIIPNEALRDRYHKVLEQVPLYVNSLGLVVAEAAFCGSCDPWLKALRAYLTANRDCLVEFVSHELAGVRTTVPDATYLAWLDFSELIRSGRLDPDPYKFFLEKAKVALNPGPQFGPGGEHCVRLNFGCSRKTLVEALRRMKDALNK